MRAALLTAPETIEVLAVNDPAPAAGEVLVRMSAVGICGTDLSVYSGDRSVSEMPWVMGHEGGGEVVAVGPGGDPARIGETVVVEPNYPCLDCSACLAGITSVCPQRAIVGINSPGLLAELVAVPSQFAHALPETVSSKEALAILEPLTVARVAIAMVTVPERANVLIAGAGSQGLMLVQLLVAQGAKPWVMELDPGRAAQARKLGAGNVADESAPLRFTYVIDAVGSADLWTVLLSRLEAPVNIIVVGMSDRPLPLSTKQITNSKMKIQGSMIYDHPDDFQGTIDMVASGDIEPEATLIAAGSLSQTPDVFSTATTSSGKPWIVFD